MQRLGRPKQARGHLSQKIGDRWRLSRVDFHSYRKPITLPPRAGPTHMSWINSRPEHVAQGGGGGGLAVKRNRPKANRDISWQSGG